MSETKRAHTMSAPLAALECALFMKQGIPRFNDDFNAMLKSFLIPLAFLPFSFIGLYYSQDQRPELSGVSYEYLALLFIGKTFFTTLLGFAMIYGFAKYYDRTRHFYRTITAGNWASIAPTLLFLPVLYSMSMGWHSWEEVYPVTIVFSIYTYALAGFILTFALKIPWEMAGFLTICGMAINETGFDVLYWLAS